MNSKWYISTLLLLFTYLGFFHEEVSVPNQEIVLEFTDTKTNKSDVKNTINHVKEKLLNVGVTNIKIQETKEGTLKISYFSLVDVDNIKEAFSGDKQLVLGKNQEDKENTSSNYSIDVYEITNDNDSYKLNDKFAFEIKNSSDRFTTNHSYASIKNIETHKANQLYKIAFKVHQKDCFRINNTSHKEPEVRAGPSKLYL